MLINAAVYYEDDYIEGVKKRIQTESEFLKSLSGCPHIVKLVDSIENARAYYFIMEHC